MQRIEVKFWMPGDGERSMMFMEDDGDKTVAMCRAMEVVEGMFPEAEGMKARVVPGVGWWTVDGNVFYFMPDCPATGDRLAEYVESGYMPGEVGRGGRVEVRGHREALGVIEFLREQGEECEYVARW